MEPKFVADAGSERWKASLACHIKNFQDDPAIRFILHHMPEDKRRGHVADVIRPSVKAAALQSAIFDEAHTTPDSDIDPDALPACSAIWVPPNRKIDDPRLYLKAGFLQLLYIIGPGALKRMALDFQARADKAKKTGLRWADGSEITAGYYYMAWVSTLVEERGKGLAGELIRRFQARASKEGFPIWTETARENSHRLYLKLGFKDVDSYLLGQGHVDSEGYAEKGGEGVRMWAMLWTPQ